MKKNVYIVFPILFLITIILVDGSNITMAEKSQLVSSCSHFSTDFYKTLSSKLSKENIVTSPTSAHLILSLLLQGADGKTKKELESSLYMLDSKRFKEEMKSLLENLSNVEKNQFEIVNALYVDNNLVISNSFVENCSSYFKTLIENVSFTNVAKTVEQINSWVSEKTGKKISHVLKSNDIDEYTLMIFINALYFKSTWKNQFDSELTEEREFHNSNKEIRYIPTMLKTLQMPFGVIEDLNSRFIKIDYLNESFEMIVILPNERYGLNDVEKNFNWEKISQASFSTKDVELSLPKFKINLSLDLKDHFINLGLKSMFGDDANFNLMSENHLHVNRVIQKVHIDVDERGSEAAVVTTARMRSRRMIVETEDFAVDHPFMFVINYKTYSIPLFIGSVRTLGEAITRDEL